MDKQGSIGELRSSTTGLMASDFDKSDKMSSNLHHNHLSLSTLQNGFPRCVIHQLGNDLSLDVTTLNQIEFIVELIHAQKNVQKEPMHLSRFDV
jgi:hypothetical protein